MSKGTIKILAIVLSLLLISTGIIMNLSSNKSHAYDESEIIEIDLPAREFGTTSEYYCLNKGLDYLPGNYVRVGGGSLDSLVAYAIGYEQYERQAGKTHYNDDAVANIVWAEMGSTHEGETILESEEYLEIIDASDIIQNLTDEDISITLQNEEIIENEKGEYGPFQIDYPYVVIQENVIGEFTIIVNEKTELRIEDLIKKEDGYYLTENQGIKEGEQNTVEIKYTANQYSGRYNQYAKEHNIYVDCQCSECKAYGYATSLGTYYRGSWRRNEDEDWAYSIEHKEGCTRSGKINNDDEVYTLVNYQDIMEPKITKEEITIRDDVTFYAGKPELELYVRKVDTNGNGLDGAGFQVYGVSQENTEITQDGGLIIKADAGEDSITIKLTETKAPDGYVKLEEPIEITYVWNSSQRKWICDTKDFKFATGEAITIIEDKDNRYTIKVENRKMISISGQVWLDEQTGIKPVSPPNGKKDGSEGGISGIQVNLKDSNNKIIATTATGTNGDYKFTNIPSGVSYYIEFVYDGINYVATTIKGDSDASEPDRTAFNNKFYTITRKLINGIMRDIAISANGNTITELDYNSSGKIQTMNGTTVNSKYAITAKTETATYNEDTTDIDLGLIKKDVDLAAVTEIYSATVKINGVTKEYENITGLEKDENGNLIIENPEQENVKYNLYLYNSDYNYRIGDYKLEAAQKDYLSVNMDTDGIASKDQKKDLLYNKRGDDGELSVEVEYQIQLNNQSATNAKINEIAYYYDARYELSEISTVLVDDYDDVIFEDPVEIDDTKYNKLILNVQKSFDSDSNQKVGNLAFVMTSGNVSIGEFKNWVEIVSYSTSDGCIDYDSAPNNIEQHIQEDDTDDAAGLNIQLNHIERQVSGYVFEDMMKSNNPGSYNTGDGVYNGSDGDKKVDDVIVQLIEIKNVTVGSTTLKLEYIWQETVSGSDTVKVVSSDGSKMINIKYTAERTLDGQTVSQNNTLYTYKYIDKDEDKDKVIEAGEYIFTDFIPGNYIVRFIYGDGTYWDTAKNTGNIITYNGQDYKSTIDVAYDKVGLYDELYKENSSMARDNEARRLEQMAYATGITATDVELLKIDKQEELNKTWMCAETSPISLNISLDEQKGDSANSITRNANFGLVKRPRALLQLEKHITGVSIDYGNIMEATTTLGKYDEALYNFENSYSDEVENKGIKVENSASIEAEATNKKYNKGGRWLIQTETDTVAGKRLEITYTYRIKNIGDIEYIGIQLDEEIRKPENSGKPTSEIYKNVAKIVKSESSKRGYTPGAYLGLAYYTGTADSGDKIVSIPVQVEDYISTGNGGLAFDTTSDDFSLLEDTTTKSIWDYSSNNVADNKGTEEVKVVQSEIEYITDESRPLTLNVYINNLDSTSSANKLTYRSYAAQLVHPTSETITNQAGTLCDDSITFGNLGNIKTDGTYHGGVKSYVDVLDKSIGGVETEEIVPELDETIAETLVITLDTGADKETPMILIATITAGLAVVAVGIVLIKKFIIK